MKPFPSVKPYSQVNPFDQQSAIDFVNRVNWLFETYDIDNMIDAFMEDSVTYHFHGTISGQEELRTFLTEVYPYLIPGVSRHATNHIVDQDEDGVVVRYHNLLVRYTSPEDAPKLRYGGLAHDDEGLPSIWIYSTMMDRLRKVDGQWKIYERHVGASTTDNKLTPKTEDAKYFDPYLPNHSPNQD